MKLKVRKKRTRIRGARSCGWGFRQKHKGPGNHGGHGMAGTGKRASQVQQKALMMARAAGCETYFGRRGYTSRSTESKKKDQINLRDIHLHMFKKENDKIELKTYKILGEGEGFKAEIIAMSASQSAIEKMNKAGGKITLPVKKEEKEVEKKEKFVKPKKEKAEKKEKVSKKK